MFLKSGGRKSGYDRDVHLVRLIAIFFALAAFSAFAWAEAQNAAAPPSSAKSTGGKEAAERLIDINRSSAAELKTLPGVGDAYAAAIIHHRPHRNKMQLRSKGVIPPAAYNRIKDRIVAKQ